MIIAKQCDPLGQIVQYLPELIIEIKFISLKLNGSRLELSINYLGYSFRYFLKEENKVKVREVMCRLEAEALDSS